MKLPDKGVHRAISNLFPQSVVSWVAVVAVVAVVAEVADKLGRAAGEGGTGKNKISRG